MSKKHPSNCERYIVEVCGTYSTKDEHFEPAYDTDDLQKARRFCAIQVATNKVIAQARVRDTQSGEFPYAVNNQAIALIDLNEYGVRPEPSEWILSYLSDDEL